MRKLQQLLFISLICFAANVFALSFKLPKRGNDLVGNIQFAVVKKGDDFSKVAQRYDVGYYDLFEANPGVDPDKPEFGTVLLIPTQFILPGRIRDGIVINLAEMRLYYFTKNKVYTYPTGIGKEGWNTPLGKSKVVAKAKNPVWYVPQSIQEYRKKNGDPVPAVVAAGPENPLGEYAIRLSAAGYLIHGTNEPEGIGRRSSAGCIRLYPKDIKQLFKMVKKDTWVHIVHEPYKAGWLQAKLYLEAHMPLKEQRIQLHDDVSVAIDVVEKAYKRKVTAESWSRIEEVAKQHLGFPQLVTVG